MLVFIAGIIAKGWIYPVNIPVFLETYNREA
jgi:hypothetical protein